MTEATEATETIETLASTETFPSHVEDSDAKADEVTDNYQYEATGLEPVTSEEQIIARDRVPATLPGSVATSEVAREAGRANAVKAGAHDSAEAALQSEMRRVSLRDVRTNPKVRAYIEKANEQMAVIGYTEHGLRHSGLVAAIARNICLELCHDARDAELAAIAGYLHDIGCCVHRLNHPQIGATIAFQLLDQMGMDAVEVGTVIGAIGNHEEPEGVPINGITAAVIIADKSDVHYTRVQNPDPTAYDIHDRVNHAVQKSYLKINPTDKTLTLDLIINTKEATVMEYMEIFVTRMRLCRTAAEKLGCNFRLIINDVEL